MLIGHYFVKLSEKGRTALPKKFREEMGDEGIIGRWYESCLIFVSSPRWQEILARLTGRTEFITQPVRDTDRFILGSAFEVELDLQGRFIIPKSLREYANLGAEVVFVGLGDRVEIWGKDSWSTHEDQVQETASQMIEKLAESKNAKGGDLGG